MEALGGKKGVFHYERISCKDFEEISEETLIPSGLGLYEMLDPEDERSHKGLYEEED